MLKLNNFKREIVYWAILIVLLFLFEAYDKHPVHLHWEELPFMIMYCIASMFISYIIIPRFLYKKKVLKFSLSVFAILCVVALMEEYVLERLFIIDMKVFEEIRLLSALIEILPPMFIFTGFKFALDALEKENRIEKLSRLAAENELQFLNSQINPHFLFNNLNNLYALALEKSTETPNVILQLSSILRYMLYDCRKKRVALSNEVENLNRFIELYRMQMGSDTLINFNTDGVSNRMEISPLILIVFVENAFKHSQASQTEAVEINVSLNVEKGILHFICENTFGEQTNVNDLSKGIGLENVRSKLRLVYPDAHKLEIKKQENRYRVSLQIEL